MPLSWEEISPKLPPKKTRLETQRTSNMLKITIPGRCLQAEEKYIQTAPTEPQFWMFKNQYQGDANNLGRNISKTAPKEPQFGDQKNKQNVQKSTPGRSLQHGEKYSPKLLQKIHSLDIMTTSHIFRKCIKGRILQARGKYFHNRSKRTIVWRYWEPAINSKFLSQEDYSKL